jgi:Holliday junction DNA helicase RuvA
MIASVQGRIQALRAQALIVQVGGVGLLVRVPDSVLDGAQVGHIVELYTHLYVRESELALYGFGTEEEHDIFTTLLGVSGIGPRTALAVLSTFSPEVLRSAITQGDVGMLTRIPGIGRKTAERMMLDLKDKVGAPSGVAWSMAAMREGDAEVINALTSLGYSLGEARDALAAVPVETKALDERILAALRSLGGA